jgi:hypothetical protein
LNRIHFAESDSPIDRARHTDHHHAADLTTTIMRWSAPSAIVGPDIGVWVTVRFLS